MNSRNAVLWLGFSLIIVRMFTTNQWSSLWGSVTTGGGTSIANALGGTGAVGNWAPAAGNAAAGAAAAAAAGAKAVANGANNAAGGGPPPSKA